MNAWNERGSGSENFGMKITEIGFTVEEIWTKEVRRAKIGIWKALGVFFCEFARALVN
jgi:hypothetical protein